MNTVAWVEANTPNLNDPAGLQGGTRAIQPDGGSGGSAIVSPTVAAGILEDILLGLGIVAAGALGGSSVVNPSSPPPNDPTTLFEAITNAIPLRELDDATRKQIADLCNASFCGIGGLVWLLAQLGINTQTGVQTDTATDTDEKEDPCTKYPYNEAVRCSDLELYNPGESYTLPSFDAALTHMAALADTNPASLVVHPNTEGDISREGPCREGKILFAQYVGRHWNIWRNQQEYRQRLQPENLPPLGAVKSCKCCDSSIKRGSPIVDRFSIVDSHGQLRTRGS